MSGRQSVLAEPCQVCPEFTGERRAVAMWRNGAIGVAGAHQKFSILRIGQKQIEYVASEARAPQRADGFQSAVELAETRIDQNRVGEEFGDL